MKGYGWCDLHYGRWKRNGDPEVSHAGRPPVNRKCKQCGRVYEVGAAYAETRGSKYCSRSCRDAGMARKTRECGWCQQTFVPKNPATVGTGRFCSQRCWRAYEHDRQPRSFEFTCACGKTFRRSAAHVKRFGKPKYCSKACASAGRVRPESVASRGPGWRKLAEVIRERDGRRCVKCGEPELPRRRHAVDHIVPWVLVKVRPEVGNDPANLATLCHRCHGIKTTVIEPRLLAGDFLAIQEFYGREVMEQAKATLGRLP